MRLEGSDKGIRPTEGHVQPNLVSSIGEFHESHIVDPELQLFDDCRAGVPADQASGRLFRLRREIHAKRAHWQRFTFHAGLPSA
jgi:hypothetical protein